MIVQAIAFWVFAVVAVISGALVVANRNPVYSVLFLFVVMMLDINFVALRQGFVRYLPIGAIVGAILVAELVFIFGGWPLGAEAARAVGSSATPSLDQVTNTQALGQLLYTQYFYLFQAAGMVLLTAMIGAIVLTLRHKPDVKRQVIAEQNARTRADAIEIVKAPSRAGV